MPEVVPVCAWDRDFLDRTLADESKPNGKSIKVLEALALVRGAACALLAVPVAPITY